MDIDGWSMVNSWYRQWEYTYHWSMLASWSRSILDGAIPFLSATTTRSSTMMLKDYHVFINHGTTNCPTKSTHTSNTHKMLAHLNKYVKLLFTPPFWWGNPSGGSSDFSRKNPSNPKISHFFAKREDTSQSNLPSPPLTSQRLEKMASWAKNQLVFQKGQGPNWFSKICFKKQTVDVRNSFHLFPLSICIIYASLVQTKQL